MYKTYEEAKAAALDIINRKYGGDKTGCVVTENKMSARSRSIWWGFHFYDADTNGEFIRREDGTYARNYAI